MIKIATQFTKTPGPRYTDEGLFSGELYRKEQFAQAIRDGLNNYEKIVVDLDGTVGYGTSFLEEIFGGLIRDDKIEYDRLIKKLKIISYEEPYLEDDVFSYLKDANEKELSKK